MKPANVALIAVLTLGLSTFGCAVKTQDPAPLSEGSLGSSADQLVSDNDEATEADSDLESGIDDPLSGSTPADPGTPADGATDADLMAKVKTNPGLFFRPAGCLTTTVSGNVATHVFNDCTGPYGLVHFNGTVVSTFVRGSGSLTITHEATDFHVNGATVSGTRVVVYSVSGTVISKHRTGDWSGTTAKGNAISHKADFTSTYDVASKCVTRDGSASTSIGGREFSISVTGYKRCGVGNLGCPESGEVVLERTKAGDSASVTVDFIGNGMVQITGPNGGQITRRMLCKV
jgi:hypothetical protein